MNRTIPKPDFRLLLFIPMLIVMYMIYGFSSDEGEKSSSLSLEVTKDIVTTVDKVMYDNQMSESNVQTWIEKLHLPVRKGAHMSEYALLALSVFLPLIAYSLRFKSMHYVIPVVVSFLYACTDEYHQTYINQRSGCFIDVLIDTSGSLILIFLAWCTVCIVKKIRSKRCKNSIDISD